MSNDFTQGLILDGGGGPDFVAVNRLFGSLDQAPFVVEAAALELLKRTQAHREATDALKDREAAVILSGELNDKSKFPNEAAREACIRLATTEERAAVEAAWLAVEFGRIELQKQNQVRIALNRLAGLMAAGLQEDDE